MKIAVSSSSRSDIGCRRERNEDAFGIGPGNTRIFWAVVCDGMGGHMSGDIASKEAVSGFASASERLHGPDFEPLDFDKVELILRSANEQVLSAHSEASRKAGMGATLVSLFIDREIADSAIIAHAGDSRIYRIRSGRIELLTTDHNVANDLKKRGLMDGETKLAPRYGEQITRFMGMTEFPTPDIARIDIRDNDFFLLCTDGLTNAVEESRILSLVDTSDPTLSVDRLIQASLDAGAPDNVTVVAVSLLVTGDDKG